MGARLATLANGEVYKLRIKKRNEDLDLALLSDDFTKGNDSLVFHGVSQMPRKKYPVFPLTLELGRNKSWHNQW